MPTNERLRESLNASGLSPHALASRLAVDPKTVERWITQGRTPYPRHRHEVAALVQESEAYLWPSAVGAERRMKAADSEIVDVYPHRAAVPSDLWARLFRGAKHRIDVLVYAGLFLPNNSPS